MSRQTSTHTRTTSIIKYKKKNMKIVSSFYFHLKQQRQVSENPWNGFLTSQNGRRTGQQAIVKLRMTSMMAGCWRWRYPLRRELVDKIWRWRKHINTKRAYIHVCWVEKQIKKTFKSRMDEMIEATYIYMYVHMYVYSMYIHMYVCMCIYRYIVSK